MSLKKWHIAGFLFISLAGVLLHYAYALSEQNHFVGYFSPVNESIWEHLKLIYWPSVIFMIAEHVTYGKSEADFFAVKMCSMIGALAFVVTFFYTYSGVLGFSLLAVDIFSYFASVGICPLISYKMFCVPTDGDKSDNLRGIVALIILGVCFVMWTYAPPYLGIFWG